MSLSMLLQPARRLQFTQVLTRVLIPRRRVLLPRSFLNLSLLYTPLFL
jgi:hypothetical protein